VRAAILSLLAEQPRNGYQLMQELEARSQGVWRPSSGSVYPTLSQLEDEGLIETTTIAGGRAFRLTKAGDDYVKNHGPELQAAWDTGSSAESGDMRLELMTLFRNIASAAMQVFQHGTADQVAEAKRLLNETRRGLYRILADDPRDENDD
jgi:DNA-binding PadR family transcriptional regulator